MLHLYDQIEAAAAAVREKWSGQPRVGIILGTGIGPLAEQIEVEASIEYESIPHFLRSTATGHRGRLVCGKLAGASVMAMEGRFHAYEGYGLDQITLPVRVMKALGAELLIVTNACGGMNPNFACGDIMVIDDHINLMGANPLVGINDDRLGPRFPDMAQPYDPALVERALAIARRQDFAAHKGRVRGRHRAQSRNSRRIPLSAHDRRRRRRHVDRAGSDRGRALRPARAGLVDRH